MDALISIGTLIIGLIIGYMGERSGFCTIGAIRNFILIRDSHLLKGVVAIIAAASVGFLLTSIAGQANGFPAFSRVDIIDNIYTACINPYGTGGQDAVDITGILTLTIVGGMGVGFFSILSNGCPFRQHIRASEGDSGSLAYILGFYLAAIVFGIVAKSMITGI